MTSDLEVVTDESKSGLSSSESDLDEYPSSSYRLFSFNSFLVIFLTTRDGLIFFEGWESRSLRISLFSWSDDAYLRLLSASSILFPCYLSLWKSDRFWNDSESRSSGSESLELDDIFSLK